MLKATIHDGNRESPVTSHTSYTLHTFIMTSNEHETPASAPQRKSPRKHSGATSNGRKPTSGRPTSTSGKPTSTSGKSASTRLKSKKLLTVMSNNIPLYAYRWGTSADGDGVHFITVDKQANRAQLKKAIWEALPQRDQLDFESLRLYKV